VVFLYVLSLWNIGNAVPLSVCLPACLSVSKAFFFLWGNPQNNFSYLEEPPLIKMVTGQKNLIAWNAGQWLIDYCHKNLFAKNCNTYIILHYKKKLKHLFLFLTLSYFFFRYQNIELWRSLKCCHFLLEISIILGGMLGIFWGPWKILVFPWFL
jgi:hypothetical protein